MKKIVCYTRSESGLITDCLTEIINIIIFLPNSTNLSRLVYFYTTRRL